MFFFKFYDIKNERYLIIKNSDILSIRQYTDTFNYRINFNTSLKREPVYDEMFITDEENVNQFLEAQVQYRSCCH